MRTLPQRRPLAVRDGVLDDLKRLSQSVMRLRSEKGKEPDINHILALLEDLTTVTGKLVAEAEEIRCQITALQHGLMAATAYRRTTNLASGRMTGDRK